MSRTLALSIALLALAVASPALGAGYEVKLRSGNVIQTRYEPETATFDESLWLVMTLRSNTMAIPKADVESIDSVVEAEGRGTRIDQVTVLIGLAPNDKPTPEELEALGEEAAPPASPYSMPLVGEPNTGGGIPVWFTGVTTPPLGGGSAAGAQAAGRRGGGGGQFVEPATRD